MTTQLHIRASYTDIAHQGTDVDVGFYRSLPGVKFELVDPHTRYPVQAIPGPKQTALAIVSAVLSSTALSHGIETWLRKEPTRIEITVEKNHEKRSLIFEGPDIKKSEADIEKLVHEFSSWAPGQELRIRATKKK